MICAACGEANREGARFCDACGERFASQCPSCGHELRHAARFCDACGSAVGGGGSTPPSRPREARKVVTVVFADLAGSTSLQERMDAELVRRVMERFYDAMRDAVTRHGGTVVKFMGDGIMAAFGVPTVAEDDAVRAVRSAAAMQGAFTAIADEVRSDWGANIGLRVGVNTGEVVVTDGEDDVVGDAVNVAARLEHAASESEVLVGQETWRLTRGFFGFEALAPLDLKGKAEPVPCYRLASLSAPAADGVSPFVGRAHELARLTAAFDAVERERRAYLVTVVGSPGLGKSRLVQELANRLRGRARIFEAPCEAGGASTFAPIAEVLRTAAGIDDTASEGDVGQAVAALFPDGETAARVAAAVGAVLGVGPSVSPEETFWAVRRVIEEVSAQGPTVVVLDDVHWGEALFLDLLEHLAEWVRSAPVLLVALARPEIRDVRAALADPAGTPKDVLVLDALPEEDVMRLASELLEGRPLAEDVAARLLSSADGNPLFLRELVKMLIDDGALRLEEGRWVVADGVEVEVPPTIHALLSARIERLGPDERSVVERASVVGHQFFRGAVAVVSPPPVASRIDSHLETLRRKEVVEPEGSYWIDEPVFRFHHALIRDAAYRRLLKEARADLHERIADWLTAKAGALVGEHEEVIGYHLEQAHGYLRDLGGANAGLDLGRRASRHLAAAARRSLEGDDLRSTAALLGRALTCLPSDDPARAELLVDRCEALLAMGEVAGGAQALRELQAVPDLSPRLAAWAQAFAAQVASFSEPEALPHWAERARAAADRLDELGDLAGAAKAAAVHAAILARLGQVAACESALDRALAAAREVGDRRRANGVLAGAPLAALWGPSPVSRAAGRCLDVVRVLRITTGSAPVEAVALRAQGMLEAFRGRFDAARRLVAASRRNLEELGLRHGILQADLSAGVVELVADDPTAAEEILRTAYDGFRALGIGVDAAQAGALLARACLARGHDEEALRLTEDSERLGGHDLKTAIAWRAVRAEVLARRGEVEAALRLAREAVDIAGTTDALVDHADARLALAAVLAAGGNARDAAAEAGRAADLYEAKGATALVQRARALADERAVGVPSSNGPDPAGSPVLAGRDSDGGATRSRAPQSAVAAVWSEWEVLYPRHDVDAILDTVSPDYVLDERQYHAQNTSRGREGLRDVLMAIFEGEFTRVDWEVLATRGAHLALVRVAWHIRARSGGELEVVHLRVGEVDHRGLLVREVAFDGDDVAAAHDELDERFLARVDSACKPVAAAAIRSRRAYNARDWDGWRRCFTDDFILVDHRTAGWGTCDLAGYLERIRGLTELAPDVVHYWTEVGGVAPDFGHGRLTAYGTHFEGGHFEVAVNLVCRTVGGRISRLELFVSEAWDESVARFHELAGQMPSTIGTAATRTWERARLGMLAGDVDAVLSTVVHDVGYEEHMRPPTELAVRGKDALAGLLTSALSPPPAGIDCEVLAVRSDTLVLTSNSYRWADEAGGERRYDHLRVDEVDPDGLIVETVTFEPDAILDAIAELDRRFARACHPELVPVLELAHAMATAYATADWDTYRARLSASFVGVDRRRTGWGEVDAEEYVARMRSLKELAPDAVLWPVRLDRVSGEVTSGEFRARGTTADGGRFELAWLSLAVTCGGLLERYELFDTDQQVALDARAEELARPAPGAPPALGDDNLAVRAWERYVPLVEIKDFDAILALQRPDYLIDQRIRSVLTVHRGAAEVRAVLEAVFDATHRLDYEVLATRGDRHALVHAVELVLDDSGGESEIEWLQLDETDESGLMALSVFFDVDDLEAAIEELEQRYLVHLGSDFAPVLELNSANRRAYNARDWDAFSATLADDFLLVDHRPGWFGTVARDDFVEGLRGLVQSAPDSRISTDEIRGITPTCVLGRVTLRGTDGKGGPFETAVDIVSVLAAGRFRRIELFDSADRARSLTRFHEVAGEDVEDFGAGNLAVEAWRRARERMCAGDVEGVVAVTVEDVFYEERKHPPAQFTLTGRRQLADMLGVMLRRGTWAVETAVVATRGDSLALTDNVFRYVDTTGGVTEYSSLRVDDADRAGMLTATVVFEPDDLRGAMDELDRRYRASLPAAHQVMLDHVLAGRRTYNAHDWDAVRSQFTDDFVLVDHRPGWFGTLDLDGYVERLQGLVEVAPDATITVFDIAQIGREAVVVGWSVAGTSVEDVAVEITMYSVGVARDRRTARFEFFPVDARQRALERFDELVNHSSMPELST